MSWALELRLLGVGLVGPGLPSWAEGARILRGEVPYQPAPAAVPAPQRLPAAERRRAGAAVKVALTVADAACLDADLDPRLLPTVFASSSGDGANCHALCETLANPVGPDRLVSPTRFTNSVHNAPAGYWHIAVGCQQASTSVCAHDDSFSAGLVAAIAQVPGLHAPLLLVASDTPYPEPLHGTRPLPDTLGIALVLSAAHGGDSRQAQATLKARLLPIAQAGPLSTCRDAALEDLRTRIPAARGLPLLEAVALRQPARVVLPGSLHLAMEIALEFDA